MKKSTKKTINYLKRYIGHEIIRTKPTSMGDWSYTLHPIFLLGFTNEGRMICNSEGKEIILSFDYINRNWISYKKALRAKNNKLNIWRGKRIKRIHPVYHNVKRKSARDRSFREIVDKSFMCIFEHQKPPILVSASKHHIVLKLQNVGLEGEIVVVDERYAKFEDWTLVE